MFIPIHDKSSQQVRKRRELHEPTTLCSSTALKGAELTACPEGQPHQVASPGHRHTPSRGPSPVLVPVSGRPSSVPLTSGTCPSPQAKLRGYLFARALQATPAAPGTPPCIPTPLSTPFVAIILWSCPRVPHHVRTAWLALLRPREVFPGPTFPVAGGVVPVLGVLFTLMRRSSAVKQRGRAESDWSVAQMTPHAAFST